MSTHSRPDEPIPWMNNAACANVAPELWFPDKGGATAEVKAICGRCPVAAECLNYAQVNMIPEGIFGGLSPLQRRRLRMKGVT